MDPKELRIGNHIYYTSNYRFKGIFDEEFARYMFDVGDEWDFLKPIPLTEQWLLKFGYEGRESFSDLKTYCGFKKGIHEIWMPFNEFLDEQYRFKINYVHQLQNLYFALTGE